MGCCARDYYIRNGRRRQQASRSCSGPLRSTAEVLAGRNEEVTAWQAGSVPRTSANTCLGPLIQLWFGAWNDLFLPPLLLFQVQLSRLFFLSSFHFPLSCTCSHSFLFPILLYYIFHLFFLPYALFSLLLRFVHTM
jgi:hypothetical protein